jgi:hypothetical protein
MQGCRVDVDDDDRLYLNKESIFFLHVISIVLLLTLHENNLYLLSKLTQ